MTDLVTPGEVGAEVDNTSAGHAWDKAGTGGWIVDGSELAGLYSAIDDNALNGFAYEGSSGLSVSIGPGEAYVAGWLVRDRVTEIDLPADSETTIYAGYDASAILQEGEAPADRENVIVGPGSAFDSTDPRLAIHTIRTDASSTTGSDDHRHFQKPLQYSAEDALLEGSVDLAIPNLYVNQDVVVDGTADLTSAIVSEAPTNETGVARQLELDNLEQSLDADKVSSGDVNTIYVSDTEPDDDDPHLWFIPE